MNYGMANVLEHPSVRPGGPFAPWGPNGVNDGHIEGRQNGMVNPMPGESPGGILPPRPMPPVFGNPGQPPPTGIMLPRPMPPVFSGGPTGVMPINGGPSGVTANVPQSLFPWGTNNYNRSNTPAPVNPLSVAMMNFKAPAGMSF